MGVIRCGMRVALVALLLLTGCHREPAPPPPLAAPQRTGQWLWSQKDVAAFTRARAAKPELVPAVFVASIDVPNGRDGNVAWHRRLSPTVAGEHAAVVVRFEDAFHRVWADPDDGAVYARVAPVVSTVASELERSEHADVLEVQLDYDVPVRLLPRWGTLVRALAAGPLADRSVWVTTIPAHLGAAGFHEAFHGAVAGHIIQVFDTGRACTEGSVKDLAGELRRAALPFRVGVGAFERGSATEHGCWVDAMGQLRAVPGFSGAWIFGAAQETRPVFERLSARVVEGS